MRFLKSSLDAKAVAADDAAVRETVCELIDAYARAATTPSASSPSDLRATRAGDPTPAWRAELGLS